MRLRLFKRTKSDEYHFQFLSKNDNVLLNSQGYKTKDARSTGIESVYKNAGQTDRYRKQTTKKGNYYFILRAGNNQEIARSPKYKSEGAADKAINKCLKGIPGLSKENPYASDGRGDNYRPLSFYNNRIDSVKDGFQTFSAEDKFWFTYNSNGAIYLISEGYQSASGRDNGIKSVKKNIKLEERYQFEKHPNGKSYFNLKAGNNQEIATSIWFDSEGAMRSAIGNVIGGSKGGSKSESKGKGNVDEYLNCKAYKGHPRLKDNTDFSTFSEGGEFYFAMLDDKDNVALRSEGYSSAKARDNGIQSVVKNIQIEERFKIVGSGDKWYIVLRAGNNQEIARSCPFGSKGAAQGFIDGDSEATAAAAVAKPKKKRKKRAKKPKVAKIEVGSGSYPCSDITYKIFKSGNGKHYFTYRNKDEKAVLISANIRGYETLAETEEIIKQIASNGSNADLFEERPTTNGKFYYYLKNDDGKNIGKSFFFNTEDEMRTAMKLFDCGASGAKVASGAGGTSSGKRDDDYLVCSAYEGHKTDDDGFCRFENNGEYFFGMIGNDGQVKLRSERYTSTAGRDNGIASVKKNRELNNRYSIEEARNIFYVILKAGNHQEIARSCPYTSRAAAEGHIADPLGLAAIAAAKAAREKRDADAVAVAEARASKAAAMSGTAASSGGKGGAREDDYLKCAEYEGHEIEADGFSRFSHGGEYYFAMHDDSGKVRFRSEGYTTTKARDNGIDSVIRNRENTKRYSVEEKMGYHFVVLKAGNHQEIARSCAYKDAAAAAMIASNPSTGFVATGLAAGLGAAGLGGGDEGAEASGEDARLAAEKKAAEKKAAEKEAAEKKAAADEEAKKKKAAAAGLAAGLGAVGMSGGDKAEAAKIAADKAKADKAAADKLAADKAAADKAAADKAAADKAAAEKKAAADEEAKKKKAAAAGLAAGLGAVGMSGGDKAEAAKIAADKAKADKAAADKAAADKAKADRAAADKTAKIAAAAAASAAIGTGAVAASKSKGGGSTATANVGDSSGASSSGGRSGGGIPWWAWILLAALLLFLLLWKGCGLCNTPEAIMTPPVIEQPVIDNTDEAEIATVPKMEVEETTPAQPTTSLANSPSHRLFELPAAGTLAKKLAYLGSNPEFGDSHGLSPEAFYNKLKARYDANAGDRKFLDDAFKAMGYVNGFAAATPAMFSSVELPRGTTGNLGYSAKHRTGYYTLPDAQRHRLAFKITGANGRDLHFMKTCGNHFYFRP